MQTSREVLGDDGLDILELIALLWKERWLVVAVTGLCTLGGVAYALLATQWYQADVVLLQQNDNKSLSSGLSQLGGLASLAGINISGGVQAQAPVAVLKSRDFAREFINDKKLIPVLYADEWDAKAERWKDSNPKKQPDIRDAVKYFDKTVRAVSEDKKTGLVTLSITWTDSNTTAEWANTLVDRINARLREQAIAEAEHNITYLRGEMGATTVASLQQSIGKVLESEMQKLLLARGREEFAFKIIDHATPPKKRIRPQRVIVVILGAFLGMAFSVFVVMVRRARKASQMTRVAASGA
jgi:uncharacterized protein involved in exopolysaccharide biosynthesis